MSQFHWEGSCRSLIRTTVGIQDSKLSREHIAIYVAKVKDGAILEQLGVNPSLIRVHSRLISLARSRPGLYPYQLVLDVEPARAAKAAPVSVAAPPLALVPEAPKVTPALKSVPASVVLLDDDNSSQSPVKVLDKPPAGAAKRVLIDLTPATPQPAKRIAREAPPEMKHVGPIRPADCNPNLFYLNYVEQLQTPNCVAFPDLFDGGMLGCILTTYEIELEWLFDRVPALLTVPLIISHGMTGLNPSLPDHIRCFKPHVKMDYGCNHGKVVLSTQNLLMMDYERKTGGLWLQDFPRKDPHTTYPAPGDFESTMADYLQRQKIPTDLLRKFDFSNAKAVLIPSCPGYFPLQSGEAHKYGHMKVRRILQQRLELPDRLVNQPSTVYCQFSSLGSLTEAYLQKELRETFTSSKNGHSSQPTDEIKLVWPTLEFVRTCLDGYAAGGSICATEKNFKSFLRDKPYLCSYAPALGRRYLPPHIKSYTRHYADGSLAWACLTSANLSTAAWGMLVKDASLLMIRHFELGVLLVPSPGERFESGQPLQEPGRRRFPFPFQTPAPQYQKPADQPWIWDLPYMKPDVHQNIWKGIEYGGIGQ